MTDAEILRGYDNAEVKAAYMLQIAYRENVSLATVARRLSRLGRLPGRSLRHAFGTNRPEVIPEPVLKDFARRHKITAQDKNVKQTGVISEYCKGCMYLADYYGRSCEYLNIEHKRRGCPAGDGCTKRKLRRAKHETE